MATFTDNPSSIQRATNPYISQVPVNAYANTEAVLQQRHDLGVQKVQQTVDNINNLPILKDTDRQYAQESLNNVRTGIVQNLKGDFKDPRFTSQIGNYISRIASDPNIQNAINSTMAIQSSNKRMQEDIDKGNINPANQTVYQRQVQAYLGDGQVGSSFKGGYVPPVDVKKQWIDAFKQVHPQSSLSEGDLIINNNGKLEVSQLGLQKIKTEGINQVTLQNLTNTVFADPSVSRQLDIEAQYHYGQMTNEQMQQLLQSRYEADRDHTNKHIQQLKLDATINNKISKTSAAEEAQQAKELLDSRLKGYQQMTQALGENPDGVKSSLYRSDLASQLINTFAWQNTSKEIVSNPVDQAQLAHINSQIALQRLALSQESNELEKEKFKYKQTQDLVKAKTQPGSDITSVINPISEDEGLKTEATFQTEVDESLKNANVVNGKNLNMIADHTSIPRPFKYDQTSGKYYLNVGLGGYSTAKEAQKAAVDITDKLYKGNYAASLTPLAKQAIIEMDAARRQHRNTQLVKQRIDNEVNQAFKDANLTPEAKAYLNEGLDPDSKYKTITTGNGTIPIDNSMLLDAATYQTSTDSKVKSAALQRLNKKLGKKNVSSEDAYQHLLLWAGKDAMDRARSLVRKNPVLGQISAYRQSLYEQAQQGKQTYIHTFNIGKDADQRSLLNEYKGLVRNQAEITNGKGNVGKIMALDPTNKNLSFAWKSETNGGLTLVAQDGKSDPIEVTLSPQAAQRASFFKAPSQFTERYGKDLEFTDYTTTDVDSYYNRDSKGGSEAGLATAHIIPGNSNYTVKYHVLGTGVPGQYTVQGWVYDKSGKLLLDNVPLVPPGAPSLLNEEGVLATVDKVLTNDNIVQAMVDYHKNTH